MPNDERDEESGKFSEKYPDEAFIEAIEEKGGAAGSQDVADAVGCPYNTAYSKLRTLENAGRISSRKVANARLWQVSDEA
jgi:GTP-sensing pleiotropic transcriptional regulator CodY